MGPAALITAILIMSPPSPARPQATLLVAHTWDGEPLPADRHVQLTLRLSDEVLEITVRAPFHGDPPPPGPAGSLDGLWDYEVVELFVAGPAGEGGAVPYTEIELSPHGHYLVLRLEGARRAVERGLPMDYTAEIEGGRWSAGALLPRTSLPAAPWRVNAYALHGAGGERRYLAMIPVPGPVPDFHRPEVFRRLRLD